MVLLFEPVFDGDATCFVGISTWRSMLSERKRGREVLVTGGTRMCTRCGAGKFAWGVGGHRIAVGQITIGSFSLLGRRSGTSRGIRTRTGGVL
jgi:hypothetical protein